MAVVEQSLGNICRKPWRLFLKLLKKKRHVSPGSQAAEEKNILLQYLSSTSSLTEPQPASIRLSCPTQTHFVQPLTPPLFFQTRLYINKDTGDFLPSPLFPVLLHEHTWQRNLRI